MIRILALFAALICAAPAIAQPLPANLDKANAIVIDTTKGRIVIKLRTDLAPGHAERIKQLGFEGMIGPIKVSCADHEGTRLSRVHQWDGKKWNIISDWYTGDDAVIEPLVKETASKYAAEKKITPRDCSKES